MKEVYKYLYEKCILTAQHREELRNHRGLTDETIKQNKFFSGGDYIKNFEEQFKDTFPKELLIKSGVFITNNDDIIISPQLLANKIIIPYINKQDEIILIRPHKLSLKGLEAEIYQEKNIKSQGIILTEGEFKATAACQLGYSCVAIPGISSFSGKHFDKLLKFLNDNKIKEIIIMFDNEIKDNPEIKKTYKENPLSRYDVEFYSWYMCKKLQDNNINIRIATIPLEWGFEGKADIDGAIAKGKTKQDFDNIIRYSKTYQDYLKSLKTECQQILKKKIAKKYLSTHIKKDFGKYIAIRKVKNQIFEEVISNFTIKIVATHETIDGIMRDVIFINEFNEKSKIFTLEPNNMPRADAFSAFCLSKGNYIWRGNKKDLADIWEAEFLNDDGRHIIEPDKVGYIKEYDLWLFENILIKGDKEIKQDENKIFWLPERGLKPVPLAITSGKSMISDGMPIMSNTPIDKMEVFQKFYDTMGEKNGKILIGWIFAIPFLEDVFKIYRCFPFMFLEGKKGSGKSTIGEWAMNFFGLENCDKQIADTTSTAIQRMLSYYSSLPIFLDEYRNTIHIIRKAGFLRNCYNRQSVGKGIKSDFGLREVKILGTLLIGGQESPADNALLSRCIKLYITKNDRTNNHFQWFMKNRSKFSSIMREYILNKEKNLDNFKKILDEGREYFLTLDVDERTAVNYSVVAAGYATITGSNDVDFAKILGEETKAIDEESEKEQEVKEFIDDLTYLKTAEKIDENYYKHGQIEGLLYIYFNGIYNVWAQETRKIKAEMPFKKQVLKKYLQEEKGYLRDDVHRIGGTPKRCMVFNVDEISEDLKVLLEE